MPMKRLPCACDCGDHAFVRTTKAGVTLVDPSDAELLKRAWQTSSKGYAQGRIGKLHRVLLNASEGSLVDHINGDRQDNRRRNLRECDDSQSIRNRGKIHRRRTTPSSQYKGVCLYPNQGWVARLTVDGKRLCLGTFDDEKTAAVAYDKAASIHHGEFARLNF